MTRSDLLEFMRGQPYAVQASMNAAGGPQAAVVGVAISDDFELVFDTLDTARKTQNLRQDPRVAFVIGGMGGDERTVQYSGVADEPSGADRDACKQRYFERFPDGPAREAWTGITYFRVRPTWLRYSDFSQSAPVILEFTGEALVALA
jgi:hypothetical protein